MLTSALVSALVSGFVFLAGETLTNWRKCRSALAKRRYTLARKRRIKLYDRQAILDCVADDR